MASFWLFLSMVLSGFLLTGGSKTVQHGTNVDPHSSPANTNDWTWKAAGDGANGSSELPHPKNTMEKHAKKSPALATPSHPSGRISQEDATSSPMKMMAKRTSKGSPEKALPETKNNTESKQPHPDTRVTWPWLIEVTSQIPHMPVSTATLRHDSDTARPVSRAKGDLHSPLKTITPSLALWDHTSTESSQRLIDDSSSSSATQKHISDSPRPSLNSKIKLLLITATSGSTQTLRHLDELWSTSSPTLMDDLEFSTATQKHSLGSARPDLNPKVKLHLATATSVPTKIQKQLDKTVSASPQTLQADLDFSTGSSRQSSGMATSGFSTTTQGTSPLATNPLIGKCLLAILILALVAAIFIVSSGVLATVLWRQKKAYRLGQANHTEMVCISSLLSAEKEEEEEEERRRQPKVKRAKLLGETGSETEVDNLTLNSFLPEH